MQTNYSLEFLLEDTGCYSSSQIKDLFPKGKKEVNYLDIINSGIPLKDKFWFFCNRVFSKEQSKQISIELTECVLPIYEEQYPDNKAPREAIEAAKLYLAGLITIGELEIKRDAAASASAAADYRASASASAVAYTACNASYAVANTTYKQKLLDILIKFIEKN